MLPVELLEREPAGALGEPPAELGVVEQALDPVGDLEPVAALEQQRVALVLEVVADVAVRERHRAPHGEELGQLRGQPVAVEVVGGAGLDEGVRERQVAGDLTPADRADLDHALAQGAERPRIDPAELGLAEAQQAYGAPASLQQLHRQIEAQHLVLVRVVDGAVIDENELVLADPEARPPQRWDQVGAEALGVDPGAGDVMREAGLVELVQLLGDHGDPRGAGHELLGAGRVDQPLRGEPVLLGHRAAPDVLDRVADRLAVEVPLVVLEMDDVGDPDPPDELLGRGPDDLARGPGEGDRRLAGSPQALRDRR